MKIVSKLLKAFGFDVLSKKTGFGRFLEKGGIKDKPSTIVGKGLYWIILLNTLVMAQDAMNFQIASKFIQGIVLYIPSIVIAIVMLALGVFLSRFVFEFVDKAARLAGLGFHAFLGAAARYTVMGLAVVTVVGYIGLPAVFVSHSVIIIFVVVPLIFCLVFVVAGRDTVSNMLAGKFLARELEIGDAIEFDSVSGNIDSIGLTVTRLKDGKEEIIVPNAELARKVIKRKS